MSAQQEARVAKKTERTAARLAKAESEREARHTRVRSFELSVATDGDHYGWGLPMTRVHADRMFDEAMGPEVVSATLRCDGRIVRRYERATGAAS